MIVGILKETRSDERRVAMVPVVAASLIKTGLQILIESGAGEASGFRDQEYTQRGATLGSRSEVLEKSEIILVVNSPTTEDLNGFRSGHIVVGMLNPFGDRDTVKAMAERGLSAFSLELLPRISRAQSMDVLSSMATVAGYKAVLLAANELPKLFPMFMTAAGTIPPARVFVIGAGVAGLQAIAAARRLGANVQAYDVRAAVKEEVQSLGARFVELPLETKAAEGAGGYAQAMDEAFYKKQQELMLKVVGESDVVITTAAIPGKKAPVLVTEPMVHAMPMGSVIVDLAAETGGNCALTKAGETIRVNGVTILGPRNVPSMMCFHASQMYARNLSSFLGILVKDKTAQLESTDELIRETLITHKGAVVHPKLQG